MPRPVTIALLIILNAIPVYGVLVWDWSSFQLIYLYWLENVIIGAFNVARMVIRPYGHMIELANPLFFAPFFAFHYGMFTTGHGTFILSLFAGDAYEHNNLFDYAGLFAPLFDQPHLQWAAAALVVWHLVDWIRHVIEKGAGSEGVKEMMTAPYRRIFVLHLTIIVSGFALGALSEPDVGLLVLIFLKVGFDIYHLRQDEAADEGPIELTQADIDEIAAKYPEPSVVVNGKTVRYDSFADLKASNHYRIMIAVLRFMGLGRQTMAIETYFDMRIREESRQTPSSKSKTPSSSNTRIPSR